MFCLISGLLLRIVQKLLCEEPHRLIQQYGAATCAPVISNVERAPTVWSSWENFRRTKRFIFKVTLRIVILNWVCYTFSTLHFHPVPSLFSSSVSCCFVLCFSFSVSFFLLVFLLFPFSYRFSLFLSSIPFNVSSKNSLIIQKEKTKEINV